MSKTIKFPRPIGRAEAVTPEAALKEIHEGIEDGTIKARSVIVIVVNQPEDGSDVELDTTLWFAGPDVARNKDIVYWGEWLKDWSMRQMRGDR